MVVGKVANLVFLISKEEGCSCNKAVEIVTQMLVDKCKEMQLATLELKEYAKSMKQQPHKWLPLIFSSQHYTNLNIDTHVYIHDYICCSYI